MKKGILITLVSLVCLIVPSVLVIAKNRTTDIEFPILTEFKLEVFREGQLSEKKLLVSLEIWKLDNSFFVEWNHVYIEPLHYRKRTLLSVRHFSTTDGFSSVKNVRVDKDGFSFRLEHAGGKGLTADVVGKKREGQSSYSVKASAIDFILFAGLKKIAETWKSTDKVIILPYREIRWGD